MGKHKVSKKHPENPFHSLTEKATDEWDADVPKPDTCWMNRVDSAAEAKLAAADLRYLADCVGALAKRNRNPRLMMVVEIIVRFRPLHEKSRG